MPQDKPWTHQDQLDLGLHLTIPKSPRKKDLRRRRNWLKCMFRNPALPNRMYSILVTLVTEV